MQISHAASILLVFIAACITGCSGPGLASTPAKSKADAQIVALINNSPITSTQLHTDLAERAGKQALFDLVLDLQLENEIRQQGFKITQPDLDQEEQLFLRTISDLDPKAPTYQLLNSLRSAKGLGPSRYPRLLRRNAMLRKLVGNVGVPTENEYLLAQQIALGPKYRVRMFVSQSRNPAIALRASTVNTPTDAQRWIFADACTTSSIHPSASRGGLIPDLNPADPGYPSTLTDAIKRTQPGQLTAVLAMDSGFAVVLIEARLKAIAPSEQQIRSIRDQLRSRKQALEMQRLAEQLVRDADITVMDRALNWAWKNSE